MTGFIQALGLLHRTFRTQGRAARVHILGRFLTCPFLRVLRHLPNEARILDLGGGHGLFARLAVEREGLRVVSLDPDLRKVLGGFSHPRVDFVAGYLDATRAAFDMITMFDVLYRIPIDERDALLAAIHARLRPGGTVLIKDLDPESGWKARWNRLQEAISDRFFHLTLGTHFAYETGDALRARLERAGFTGFKAIPVGDWYPHAHVLWIANRE